MQVGGYYYLEYYYCTIQHQISQTQTAQSLMNLSNKSTLLLS